MGSLVFYFKTIILFNMFILIEIIIFLISCVFSGVFFFKYYWRKKIKIQKEYEEKRGELVYKLELIKDELENKKYEAELVKLEKLEKLETLKKFVARVKKKAENKVKIIEKESKKALKEVLTEEDENLEIIDKFFKFALKTRIGYLRYDEDEYIQKGEFKKHFLRKVLLDNKIID